MTQKSKTIVVLGALVAVGVALIGISVANDQSKEQVSTAQVQQKQTADMISYPGEEGKTALALLKSSYNVETKTFDGIGEMVVGINGVTPDDKHFWALYVNGKAASVGAGKYVTKNGDKISWKLDTVK